MISDSIISSATHANILNRKIKALTKELDNCKVLLREWGIGFNSEGKSMVEVPTTEGVLTIVFPGLKPEFVEGTDPRSLNSALMITTLSKVLEFKPVIVKVFKDSWEAENGFTKKERAIIGKVIEFKEQTPRIETSK